MNWSTFKAQRQALLQQLADLERYLGTGRRRPARVPSIGWELQPDGRLIPLTPTRALALVKPRFRVPRLRRRRA
jgi:hypothetical protein